MIQQIPKSQLMEYWPYFKGHRFLNPLAQNLAWSKVEGYVDEFENPEVIIFMCQQWACYLAGNSRSKNLKEFLVKIPEKAFIYTTQDDWELRLKAHWKYFGYFPRTELSAQNLSLQNIRRLLTQLPERYKMKKVDLDVAKQILRQKLSDHWVNAINFIGGPEKFVEEGVGFCILEGNKVISIVMSFKASVPITQSMEIDVVTHPDYRGLGLATLVSAKLIEYCLERGIEPHWDAANQISVRLAKKLGFTDPEPYRCYYWREKPWTVSELRKAYDPQVEKGSESINNLKSEIKSFLVKEHFKEDRTSLLSRLIKVQGSFDRILSDVNRFLGTSIVEESDIPQFKEFRSIIMDHLKTLNGLRAELNQD